MAKYWKDKRTSHYKKQKGRSNPYLENRKKYVTKEVDSTLAFTEKLLNQKLAANDKLSAQGVAVHSLVNRRTSSTYLNEVKDYSDTNLDSRADVVALSRKLRSREGVCSSVADLLTDFAITDGKFYSDNEELQTILNEWAKFVNSAPQVNLKGTVFPTPGLRSFGRKIFDDYLTDGDAVFTLNWQQGIKMNPAATAESYFLPISIKALDTLTLAADEDLAKIGYERLVLKIPNAVKEKIINPVTDADKLLSKTVPKEWKKYLNNDEDIVLDPNVTYHIKRNGKDYKAWGESLFIKAFSAIANKRRLQAVDEATIEGLINRFTIFKVGLADKEKNPAYHIPSQARVQALVDIVTNPKRANAAVWPGPDLEVIDIGPNGKILEVTDKYDQTDKDILRALHVSPLLIDGGSSGQSVRDWAAFISTEVGLDAIRNELQLIYTRIGQDIAVANNIQFEKISFKFDTQLLKDEERVRNFALKVFELGGISIETFVGTMGYDFGEEKTRKEKEAADNLEEIFVNRTLPYQGNDSIDKVDNDPSKTVDPDGGNKTTSAAVKSNEKFFNSIYHSTFNKIKKDIRSKVNTGNNDFDLVVLSLTSGFALFNSFIEMQLREAFYNNVDVAGNYDEFISMLMAWNKKYVDKFYVDLKAELRASYEDYNLFNNALESQEYRISQYAKESYRKAAFFGKAASAKRKGYTTGLWKTNITDETCPICFANNGLYFSISELLTSFPPHNNCNCDIEYGGKNEQS